MAGINARAARAFSDEVKREREVVASWMIANGYAIGHGDTIEELLGELKVQLDEVHLRSMALMAENETLAAAVRAKGSRT